MHAKLILIKIKLFPKKVHLHVKNISSVKFRLCDDRLKIAAENVPFTNLGHNTVTNVLIRCHKALSVC